MLDPNRPPAPSPMRDLRVLAVGAKILFALSAFLAFAGSLNGAFGLLAAAMALHTLRNTPPSPAGGASSGAAAG